MISVQQEELSAVSQRLTGERGEEAEAGEFVVSAIEDVARLNADGGSSAPLGVVVGGIWIEDLGGEEKVAEGGDVAVDVAEGDDSLVFWEGGAVVVDADGGGWEGVGGEEVGGEEGGEGGGGIEGALWRRRVHFVTCICICVCIRIRFAVVFVVFVVFFIAAISKRRKEI